ncbi:hypothetical protein FMM05_17465 [Flavobacterium zepuense]|uniref:Uncharacterized protein n=1 Tax=Flavobacterium zepuense TaxID=2593302 RepID=A0A552UVN1_9FLAO|nr:hypothetical protein [Flavobacterium zepuense]TRW22294.1 hypothetical protein FMM05_17465 [Flavobacterium zepuense]
MALSDAQKDLYRELLDTNTVLDDLHELLKKYKDDNKSLIRLSGTKPDLINNIFEAVDANIISLIEIQSLIKDTEEYGDQHIFVFGLLNNTRAPYYNDANGLATKIIPSNKRSNFPLLTMMPENFEWADFRSPNRGIDNSWYMKMYDLKIRETKENDDFDAVTNRRTVVYKVYPTRMVYSIEWDGNDRIEIKVNRTTFDSAKSLKKSIAQVKNAVFGGGNGVLVDQDFAPVDLRDGIARILENSEENSSIYKLIMANFVDSKGGSGQFRSIDDYGDDDLLSESSRKSAIEAYQDGNASCTVLHVRFLASGSGGALKNDVNVIISRDAINHLIIPAKIKPSEYRYVRRQIY